MGKQSPFFYLPRYFEWNFLISIAWVCFPIQVIYYFLLYKLCNNKCFVACILIYVCGCVCFSACELVFVDDSLRWICQVNVYAHYLPLYKGFYFLPLQRRVKNMTLEPDTQGVNAHSDPAQLCDSGQFTQPLSASHFSPVKWGIESASVGVL